MAEPQTNPFAERPAPLGTMLSTAGRRLASELDAALEAAGFADLRSAHAPLFMAIDPDGTTVTELAERARVTKQSMGELVRYLARRGYVEVAVSDADRRARIVRMTAEGWRAVEVGTRVLDAFDAWLEESIGAEQVRDLRGTLGRIIDGRGPGAAADGAS